MPRGALAPLWHHGHDVDQAAEDRRPRNPEALITLTLVKADESVRLGIEVPVRQTSIQVEDIELILVPVDSNRVFKLNVER